VAPDRLSHLSKGVPHRAYTSPLPSVDEASETIFYLFSVFHRTAAWCSEQAKEITCLRKWFSEALRCQLRVGTHFNSVLNFAVCLCNLAEGVMMQECLRISKIASGIERAYRTQDEECEPIFDDEEEGEVGLTQRVGPRCASSVLTQDYVTYLPDSIRSRSVFLMERMRSKYVSLTKTTEGLDKCLRVLHSGCVDEILRMRNVLYKIGTTIRTLDSMFAKTVNGLPPQNGCLIAPSRKAKRRCRSDAQPDDEVMTADCIVCCETKPVGRFPDMWACQCTEEHSICSTCMSMLMQRDKCPYCNTVIRK